MTRFQIVTCDEQGNLASQEFETADPTAAFEVRGYRNSGIATNERLRPELRHQPTFQGLHGPMWGGQSEGVPVIRYEDPRAYDLLST